MNRETKGTAPEASDIQHIKETSDSEDLEIGEETSASENRENGKGMSIQEDSEGVESTNTEGTSAPEDQENRKEISTQEDSEGVESANTEGAEDLENGKGISTQENSEGVESSNTEGTSAPEDRENGKEISTQEDAEGVESANTEGTSIPEGRENGKGISTQEDSEGVESANTKGTLPPEDREKGKGISTQEDSESIESANTQGTSAPKDRENGKGISTQEDSEGVEFANTEGTSAPEDQENGKGISTLEASDTIESANAEGTSASEDRENGKGISTQEDSKAVESANTEGSTVLEEREIVEERSIPEASEPVEFANTEDTPAPGDPEIVEERATPEVLNNSTFNNDLPTGNSIFYAPDRIRCRRQSDFEPKVVSIGPYFHGEGDLTFTESLKDSCMSKLLNNQPVDMNVLVNQFQSFLLRKKPRSSLESFENQARRFYKEELSHSSENFIQMLIRDSCFIIHVILFLSKEVTDSKNISKEVTNSRNISEEVTDSKNISKEVTDSRIISEEVTDSRNISEEVTDSKNKVRSNLSFEKLSLSKKGQAYIKEVRSDLLLLENQIPLFFLEDVYNWLASQSDQRIPPYTTALAQFIGVDMPWKINQKNIGNAAHLLELYWRCSWPPEMNKRLEESPRDSEQKQPKSAQNHPWLVHATELHKKAGIKFKELNDKDHYEGLSVIFSNGIMRMPRLKIDSSQTTLLVNLIAFETSKSPNEQIFSGYIKLMDALINSERDVEILEQRGVICNTLSSPKMVATFFNDVGNFCSISSEEPLFFNLFSDVQKYYYSTWHRAWASLRHDYFKSPWSYISVGAGTALLLLALTQTVFTIYDHCKRIKHY